MTRLAIVLSLLLALPGLAWAQAAPPKTELLFLMEDVPAGLDLDGPSVSIGTSQTGYLNMSEGLVYYPYGPMDEGGVRRLDFSRHEPRLAESWAFDAATNTWTFHLRHGVKSCAGNEFSADDVIYSYQRAKSVSGSSPTSWFLGSVAGIKGFTRDVFKPGADRSLGDGVEKVDDYTVRFRQAAPNRLFLTALSVYAAFPYDSREMKAHATPEDPWSHIYANTVTSPAYGPYCLERWVRDDEFVLKANPNYWRGKPAIERVVMKKVPQSANRVLTLRAGKADLTQRLTAREFAGLRSTPGVTVAGIFGNETLFLSLNFKSPPFDNPKVRQAIAYAMPYKQIAAIGYSGAARRWEAQIPSTFPGYIRPSAQFDTDLAKSKQLLAEAGYPDGKGLEAFASAFHLAFTAERESVLGPVATVMQSALKDAGFPVVLEPMPQTQFVDRRTVKKEMPMAISDVEKAVGPDVTYTLMLYFLTPAAGGVTNMVNYSNPDLDRMWAQARDEMDDAKQAAMLKTMQETVQQDLAWVPILETRLQWAFRTGLHGITWHPDNSVRFYDLSFGP